MWGEVGMNGGKRAMVRGIVKGVRLNPPVPLLAAEPTPPSVSRKLRLT